MTEYQNGSLYRAYGLTLESEIDLPELARIDRSDSEVHRPTDVTIRVGDVPDHLPGRPVPKAWLDADEQSCLLRFNGIGKFLVKGGCRVIVEKAPEASFGDLRGFLLGSAIAAVVHQRGLVPLHVSAVLAPEGAIAFTGESGAGKSTIAAHLHRQMNWAVISDDVSRVHHAGDGFEIESGVHTVKLWQDALNSLDRTSEGLRRDLTRYDKFHAIDSDKFAAGTVPLSRLVWLKWGDNLSLKPLKGRHAFQAVLNAVYRPEIARMCGNRDRVVETAMAMAGAISVFELERPKMDQIGAGVRASIARLFDGQVSA